MEKSHYIKSKDASDQSRFIYPLLTDIFREFIRLAPNLVDDVIGEEFKP